MRAIILTLAMVMLIAGSAYAQVDLTGVTLDTTSPLALAAMAVSGLAVIWGIRKVIKTVNRS